jgi:hypothetical protein
MVTVDRSAAISKKEDIEDEKGILHLRKLDQMLGEVGFD